jgi:cytochrome c oxidase cbb3-type subunit 4
MDASIFLHSVMTWVAFITFVGIVIWAWSRRRKREFDEAANAPFALPDDAKGADKPAKGGHGGRKA